MSKGAANIVRITGPHPLFRSCNMNASESPNIKVVTTSAILCDSATADAEADTPRARLHNMGLNLHSSANELF